MEMERVFDSELWRVELGDQATRCMKGENGPKGAGIVAGRAYRGRRFAQMERFRRVYGQKLPWGRGTI